MAIRTIVKEGEEPLRKRSKEVTVFDHRLSVLMDDMIETLHKAEGCGLAAPQVGILKRAVIVEPKVGEPIIELINPVIVEQSGEQVDYEGCLSVNPSKNCKVKRPYKLKVEAYDRYGKPMTLDAEGWTARIVCHELDHLDGILFIDKRYKD
ncbi:MAG TPA: peptide deformylase [Candidatus Stercoripulliclostridium merdipullorum]|uniref:Peptide deformylase n=1 Tax=Candidatus Stercoripulliclostridium merdipullorum TaxID=2840952 RepID=A0A9D1NB60_9FIRM|nr:peptide deformylase [Candidatus Stercoripulliclostridium merdipullorum]